MSKHNPEKKHSGFEKKHPSKVRIRNDLNADVLFKMIRGEFKKIPEFRNGEVDITIADALMSGFAMFSLKDSSLLQFDNRRKEPAEVENLKKVFGISVVPCDTRMREINDEIDPMKYISPTFKKIFGKIQRGKILEPFMFYEGCYLLNVDGTGVFSSKKNHSPFCMEKKSKKTGVITYYLQMLGASIVHPDFREVIPLCPEMIMKKDGETKNDCERNAAKRFFEQLRKDHPHLKLIINEDALNPNAPHIRDMEQYDLHYILGVKPGDHEFLFDEVMTAVDEKRTIEFIRIDKEHADIRHQFRILNQVSLNKSNKESRVNFLEYWEKSEKSEKPNQITYHNSWITDFTLTEDNAHTIMRGGRARWKIENETFNTLKNQGYNLEHNYGLGKKNLAVVFIMLMMSAFLVDQTQQLCCSLFKSVWKKLGSKKLLWETIRSYFKTYLISSMELLYRALLYGYRAQNLEDLINITDTS
jgi:hypothetical protein